MRFVSLLLTSSLFVLLFPFKVFAITTPTWFIESFQSDINTSNSSRVSITETIKAQFGSERKHGIIRVIPTIYRTLTETNLDIRLKVLSVTDEKGSPVKYSESRRDGEVTLKIGHPDVTVSGLQTYVISYTVDNALTNPEGVPELYWNVTGNKWDVPIHAAKASLFTSPNAAKKIICFTGLVGSRTQNCQIQQSETLTTVESSDLSLGEGLTVAFSFDPAIITLPTPLQQWWWYFADNWIVLMPLFTLLFMLRLYWMEGRDRQFKGMFDESVETPIPLFAKLSKTMVFSPPEHLSPGEVGVLVDERVQMKDITAVAIDLASRGFFTIKEIGTKNFLFDTLDFELTFSSKNETQLLSFEKHVLDMLFGASRKKVVMLSKLPEKSYESLNDAILALYTHATQAGFFLAGPNTVRSFYTTLGILLCVFSFFQGLLFSTWFNPIVSGTAVFLSGIIVLFFAPNMPARTGKGRKYLQEIVGLREWIRIGAWREKIHEKNNFLEEVLPYTIVFGLTHKFIQAFSSADLQKLSWYSAADPHRFNFNSSVLAFEQHMQTGVATTRPQTSTTSYGGFGKTGSSTGGSGFSGGSSGGGFGGGGGSSW